MKTKILRSAFLGLLLGLIAVQTAEAGLLKRFIYGDIPGTAVTNLFGTNNFGVVVFPNSPTVEELIPADSIYGPFYAESVNVSPAMGDYYGSWTPGYVEPPQTGNYVFYLSGDDETQLWLTSDPADPKNPAKKQMIATVVNPLSPGTGYSSYRQWNKYATQQSAPIYLEKGKRYYIEVLHKEGSGGDHIELGWQTPDGKIQQPMSSFYFQPTQDMEELPLGGPFIGLVNPNPNPWDPATYDWYTVYDGNNVAVWVDLLNVDIANQAVTFTWYKNNQVISGADLSYHFFRATMADNGATFRVRVQVGSQTYTSGDMGLTVNPDTTVPTVTSAGMAANNPTELRVEFSEDVEEATAEALSSYQLPGGVIQSASLQGDNRTVVLKTELLQPTQTYTLTIRNVRD
ncbi:MAG TPA: PA14 domain-containing protein [Verrucomicrobiota bacterium]|nr:PA14 domain-containing protein [Verrucomicrobiota bacterium]